MWYSLIKIMATSDIHKHKYLKCIKLAFIVGIFVWLSSWAFHITTDLNSASSGPDERLRMLVPTYIYEHHELPTGYDQEAIYDKGNWSYAFYPQILGAATSALFMTITDLISSSDAGLVVPARLASVVFGTATVYVFGLFIRKLFASSRHAEIYSYAAMIMLAFWPQFAFLSGYVNNDIVALFGVSLISYASILGIKDGWHRLNSILLGFGFAICLLGYTNSYGFVLFGALFFLITLLYQYKPLGFKKAWKPLLLVCLVPIIIAGPFYVRNAVIYDGDVLGLATFKERTTQWENEHGERVQISYRQAGGGDVFDLLRDKDYLIRQQKSFTAYFGYMTINPPSQYVLIYRLVVLVGLVGFLSLFIKNIRNNTLKKNRKNVLLALFFGFSSLITFGLSVYYSLTIDSQPQGRYIIYLLIPLLVFCVVGLGFLINKISYKRIRSLLVATILLLYIINSIIIFSTYIA